MYDGRVIAWTGGRKDGKSVILRWVAHLKIKFEQKQYIPALHWQNNDHLERILEMMLVLLACE